MTHKVSSGTLNLYLLTTTIWGKPPRQTPPRLNSPSPRQVIAGVGIRIDGLLSNFGLDLNIIVHFSIPFVLLPYL